MCERFANKLTWAEICRFYRLAMSDRPGRNLPARYNICPASIIDVVIERGGKRELVSMRWGLVPKSWDWWRDSLEELPAVFNEPTEKVATDPLFCSTFESARCLIPMSGYYEWQAMPDGKQPIYFSARDGGPLTAAGLCDEWRNIETGELLTSCTMIITEANAFVRRVREQMPALLTPNDFDAWLSGKAGTDLLRPAGDDVLQAWPVSRRVGSILTPDNDPSLIEAIAAKT